MSDAFRRALCRHFGERHAVELRLLAGGLFPPADRDVDERRTDLDGTAAPAELLCGDQLRALPENGSNTTAPGLVCLRIGRANSSVGFSVGCELPTTRALPSQSTSQTELCSCTPSCSGLSP